MGDGSEPTSLLAVQVPEDPRSQNPESLENQDTYLPLEAEKYRAQAAIQPFNHKECCFFYPIPEHLQRAWV